MLPSTPLHHLLLDAAARPLVMTSGNISDEPIAIDDGDARARLDGIADLVLGRQGYLGLKRRLLRAGPRFLWDVARTRAA